MDMLISLAKSASVCIIGRMKKPVRMFLALTVLVASLILLVWAYWPGERILRRQFIQPTEMQLPTPGGFIPLFSELVWVHQKVETACLQLVADRFALIL
jgi:hypothetical protein